MPIKHQAASYRNRDGIRYENHGDICEGDVRASAKAQVRAFRQSGRRAFYEVRAEGFARVFVEPKGDSR